MYTTIGSAQVKQYEKPCIQSKMTSYVEIDHGITLEPTLGNFITGIILCR